MNDCSICKNYEPVTAKMAGQKTAKGNPDVVQVVRCKDCADPHNHCTDCPRMNGPIMRIEDYPAADVKPVVRGEWIRRDDSIFAECPNCGCEVMQIKTSVFRDGKGHIDFCPNCGADMREG